MHISYDYSELIEELEGDIEEGLIEQDGDLLVVRSEKTIQSENGPYHPIVDYYAVDFEEDITKEIQELEENPSRAHCQELENLLKADRKLLRFYNKDKKAGRLEKKAVNDIIVEMNDWNRIV